jgi:hypothetical protein
MEEKDEQFDHLCPKCMGVLEAGRVSFYTTDGLTIYWKLGEQPKGFLRSWFDPRPTEKMEITGWMNSGERDGLRCKSCRLVLFEY